jgi:histone deacetylase 1/2
MTAAQSRGWVITTRMALATASKGTSSIADFFSKMKGLADDMAAVSKKLKDEEAASYILASLDEDFKPVVSMISACTTPIMLGELYTQLTGWEQWMNLLNPASGGSNSSLTNSANRGGRGGFKSGGGGRGRGGHGRGNNGGNGGHPHNSDRVCQLCGKEGYTIERCHKRFDASFQGVSEQRSITTATNNSYGIDTNWYTNSGATNHITGELEKLTARDKYQDNDQVHNASGVGMRIKQIGKSFVHTPNHDLVLNNVLYIPEASKNLVSVHRLTFYNQAFIEYHPYCFTIKDQVMKKTLLRGACEGGLYPLKSRFPSSSNKVTFGTTRTSSSRWHSRLGHPSSPVVQQVLSQNQIYFVPDLIK